MPFGTNREREIYCGGDWRGSGGLGAGSLGGWEAQNSYPTPITPPQGICLPGEARFHPAAARPCSQCLSTESTEQRWRCIRLCAQASGPRPLPVAPPSSQTASPVASREHFILVFREGENRGRVRPASGEGGRNAPRQGCLGSRAGPGARISPRSQPPRAPLAPCFHTRNAQCGESTQTAQL